MDDQERDFFDKQSIEFARVIAEGGFGVIYLVYHSVYDQHFALKKVPEDRFKEDEVECLKQLDQPNIISLYNTYKFQNYVYLLMEYCPYDLYHLLKKSPDTPIETLGKYCHDILMAIKACHDHNIAHNDIKPSNLLIDKYGRIKICDFGLTSVYDDMKCKSTYKGTMLFKAPELFRKQDYNPMKADIWAIGVTFYYMVTQTYPFYANDRTVLKKIVETGVYAVGAVPYPSFIQVISRCLVVDPESRATVDELLALPFFQPYKAQKMQKKSVSIKVTQSQNSVIIKPILAMRNKMQDRASLKPFKMKTGKAFFMGTAK